MQKDDLVEQARFMQDVGWQEFINGKWTREVPSKPGRYPVADHAGLDAGSVVILEFGGKPLYVKDGVHKTDPNEVWVGWWWSEPQPPLPPAPPIMPED